MKQSTRKLRKARAKRKQYEKQRDKNRFLKRKGKRTPQPSTTKAMKLKLLPANLVEQINVFNDEARHKSIALLLANQYSQNATAKILNISKTDVSVVAKEIAKKVEGLKHTNKAAK